MTAPSATEFDRPADKGRYPQATSLEIEHRVESRRTEVPPRLPRGWAHLRLSVRDLVRLLRRVPDRARSWRTERWAPPSRTTALRTERDLGALFEPAVQRVVAAPSTGHADVVHLLALPVRARWCDAGEFFSLPAPSRFAGFRNWLIAREPHRPRRLRPHAHGTAPHVPPVGLRRHALPVPRRSTTTAA